MNYLKQKSFFKFITQSLNVIMKNKSIKLLGLVALLAFTACKNKDQKKKDLEATVKSFNQSAKTVADTTRGFSIDVPEGWQRVEKQMNGRRFTFLMGPKVNNFQANLNILKDDAKGMDLDQYVDYSLKHMGAITPGNLKESDIDINGIKGKLVQYTMAYQSSNMQLGSYILPVNGGSVYIITTTELVADKLQFAELFDKTVHTFKVQ